MASKLDCATWPLPLGRSTTHLGLHARHACVSKSWREHPDIGVLGGFCSARDRLTAKSVKTLLIDNHDSYTYNLYQLIAAVNGESPTVISNDEITWRELSAKLARAEFDNVVISPGPGTPVNPRDLGVCKAVLEEAAETPVLGVCLGMQALAHVHGAKVTQAKAPIHGRLSHISHSGHPLFRDIPSGRDSESLAVRYHSLAVLPESLPQCLEAIAWTSGVDQSLHLAPQELTLGKDTLEESSSEKHGIIMGLAHKTRLHWGVQFHPESVGTKFGHQLLRNFRDATGRHRETQQSCGGLPSPKRSRVGSQTPQLGRPAESEARSTRSAYVTRSSDTAENTTIAPENISNSDDPASASISFSHDQHRDSRASNGLSQPSDLDTLQLHWSVLRGVAKQVGDSQGLFTALHDCTQGDTFWLDSSAKQGQRFSYMGCKGGSLWQKLTFKLAKPEPQSSALPQGDMQIEDSNGDVKWVRCHFLDHLQSQLDQHRCQVDQQLPFDFQGGYVGYLGYEMKAECGAPGLHHSSDADAAFFFADRLLVVDHHTQDVYLVALSQKGNPEQQQESQQWLSDMRGRVAALAMPKLPSLNDQREPSVSGYTATSGGSNSTDTCVNSRPNFGDSELILGREDWVARRNRAGYVDDIQACLNALHQGESYELCLTTMLKHLQSVDPMLLYLTLRRLNPSMHAAWLDFGSVAPKICCSSPERFLKCDRHGWVEARPIKGTARRYTDPILDEQAKVSLRTCPKARAENLMIVDLLRNDLGRFCEVGSVHVPGLMEVESYATVHNLVSTIRGMRKASASVVDCLRAAFPGGSMTGAPKLRSMQILDRLENGPRGVYSGSLGFVGVNGTFDLNIVIRTAIVSEDSVQIGAGGAIVLDSDPEGEYEEMRLKASALIRAIDQHRADPSLGRAQHDESTLVKAS